MARGKEEDRREFLDAVLAEMGAVGMVEQDAEVTIWQQMIRCGDF